jgi:hypothetical protein
VTVGSMAPRPAIGAILAEAGTTVPAPLPPNGRGARAGTVLRAPVPVPRRAPRSHPAGVQAGSSLPDRVGAGGVREEPGASFPGRAAASGRRRRYRDRTGEVFGALTVLRYVRTDRDRAAVFACRCDCGRADCKGEVERSSHALRNRAVPDCQVRQYNCRHPWVPRERPRLVRPEPGSLPPRPPWSRSADERADRDARLLAAFSEADLR